MTGRNGFLEQQEWLYLLYVSVTKPALHPQGRLGHSTGERSLCQCVFDSPTEFKIVSQSAPGGKHEQVVGGTGRVQIRKLVVFSSRPRIPS